VAEAVVVAVAVAVVAVEDGVSLLPRVPDTAIARA